MAIFHVHSSVVSRSAGRNAIAAAAYRSGSLLVDNLSGERHDYRRKQGVLFSTLILPGCEGLVDRQEFWNRVEQHHRRGDSVVAREYEISLPHELSNEQNFDLALNFSRWLSHKYSIAADVSVHGPRHDRQEGVSNKNIHMHILLSACHVLPNGQLGRKCLLLGPIYSTKNGLATSTFVDRLAWQSICNQYLSEAGYYEAVDARSYKESGQTHLVPGIHLGPARAAILQKGNKENALKPVPMLRPRRVRNRLKFGWSQDLETVGRLVDAHLDLARLEASWAFRRFAIEIASHEHLRVELDGFSAERKRGWGDAATTPVF